MQKIKYSQAANNQTAQINSTSNPITAALASALTSGIAASTNSTAQQASGATNSTSDSGAGAGAGTGTNVFNGQSNSSDALGFVGPTNYSISAPPYAVKDCNQVLLVDVQRITDMKDYCKKEQGFFTMSIYMINIFQAKDSNKLIDSLTMDKLVNTPYDLPGAPNCMNFEGKTKGIAICVQSPDIVFQLKQAYEEFLRCRKGLKPLTPEEILRLMKECENLKKLMTATKSDPKIERGRPISVYN